MATSAEVLDLLVEFRRSSGFARARAAGEAIRGFASLSSDDKREVALLIAERAAPDLVPRIREQTGVELSKEQIQVVLDMVRDLDAEDVEELRRVVTDPEAREAALRATGTAAAAAAAEATGLDDDDDELPPPPPPGGGPGDAASEELEAADAAIADAERRRREIEERAERELAEARQELEELTAGETDDEGTLQFADPAELDDVPAAAEAPGAEPLRAELTDAELPGLEEAGVQAEPAPYEPVFLERDLPGSEQAMRVWGAARPAVPRGPARGLAQRLREAGSSGARLALLTAALDEVLGLTSEQIIEVILAIPDGWARRRAVERLLEHDAILAREVPDTVRLLARPMDRTWVAATAVEARLLELDELDGLLDERAAARLRRRYA